MLRHRYLQILSSPSSYKLLNDYLTENRDTALCFIGYSANFIAFLISKYPILKNKLLRLLFVLKLVSKEKLKQSTELSERSKERIKSLKKLYSYISDIRIAQNIFGLVPFLQDFFQNYNSVKKLKQSFASIDKANDLYNFLVWSSCVFYENLGFLTGHGFLISDKFNYFIFSRDLKDKDLSNSDWYYIYSCRIWCFFNLFDILNCIKNRQQLSLSIITDLILSIHWSLKEGLLSSDEFAVIGFINATNKLKKSILK